MTVAEKLKKGTFKHIESELYSFHDTKREIQRLRDNIMNPFEEDPDDPTIVKGANSVRMPGDPTGRTATKLVTNKKLEQMENIVYAIQKVYDEAPEDYKNLIRVKYWTKPQTLTWDGIALELNVSKRQAMRWRDEVVYAISEVVGWR